MRVVRPTLASVASRADVSRQTVSNVLNAPHLVRPETVRRVQAVIDEVGYRPHHAARALRTSRSRLIGVRMLPFQEVSGIVADRFLHAVIEAGQRSGYRTLLFTAPDDDGEIREYDDLLATLNLDAFVLTGTHHGDGRSAWLSARGIPYVTFGRPWGSEGESAKHSWVDVDGAAGTAEVTAALLAAGHARIAFVGWPAGSGVGDDRRDGWRRTVRASAYPESLNLDAAQPDGVATGERAARELLRADPPPTAFVCASDQLALGVQSALGDHPDPTARGAVVVGFDDTPVAAAKGISSIAQPLSDIAAHCVRILTGVLDRPPPPGSQDGGRAAAPEHVLLRPTVVLRQGLSPPMTPATAP